MAYTSVTVTGTATFPSGKLIPGALVNFDADEGVLNGGAALGGVQAVADGSGVFSIVVNATDDVGTAPTNGKYEATITDPVTGEKVFFERLTVAHASTPITLTALVAAQ